MPIAKSTTIDAVEFDNLNYNQPPTFVIYIPMSDK